MILIGKARRFVAEAVAALPPREQEAWRAFDQSERRDLPRDVAEIALRALEAAEHQMMDRIERPTSENEYSDLVNDLCFVQAIADDLRSERVG